MLSGRPGTLSEFKSEQPLFLSTSLIAMTTTDTTHPYTGVFPIAPTPFKEDESLDLPGQKRVLDCMVDQGVDGICILAL